MRTRIEPWRAALLSALGLCPSACGGEAVSQDAADVVTGDVSPTTPLPTHSAMDGESEQDEAAATPCGESTRLVGAFDQGLARCENGVVHRVEAVECENHLDERQDDVFAAPAETELTNCSRDSDCDAQPYGRCMPRGVPFVYYYECEYGCVRDSDCSTGQICMCSDGVIGQCSNSNCTTDEDCGGEFLCAQRTDATSCGAPPIYACQTAQDECAVGSDCPLSQYCEVSDGMRTCLPHPAVCGRPFLVSERARLAPLIDRSDWRAGLEGALSIADLTPRQRALLGERWAEIALMEHASIAAFARFTLQLLEVGAPAELVSASQSAMCDETIHARLTFELASRYLGRQVGPGALDIAGSGNELDLRQIVRLVLLEGCVGETVAALEASEAYACSSDSCVNAVLERIAQDERAHAELAWRFVSWAMRSDPSVAHVVRESLDEFEQEVCEQMTPPTSSRSDVDGFDVLAHGVIPSSMHAELRQIALREIVLPCGRALLASLEGLGPPVVEHHTPPSPSFVGPGVLDLDT